MQYCNANEPNKTILATVIKETNKATSPLYCLIGVTPASSPGQIAITTVTTQQAVSRCQLSRHNVLLPGEFCPSPRRPGSSAGVHAMLLFSTWFQIVFTQPVVDLSFCPGFIIAITLLQNTDKFFGLAMEPGEIFISEFVPCCCTWLLTSCHLSSKISLIVSRSIPPRPL